MRAQLASTFKDHAVAAQTNGGKHSVFKASGLIDQQLNTTVVNSGHFELSCPVPKINLQQPPALISRLHPETYER